MIRFSCIIFSLYLPSIDKKYVVDEIFNHIRATVPESKIFIGIQYNSIPETESIISKLIPIFNIEYKRAKTELAINSDASGYITALELYSKSDMKFDFVYFIHTKGITSNNDNLRRDLLSIIFDNKTTTKYLKSPEIGSFSPYITITDWDYNIKLLSSMTKFAPDLLLYTPLEYYYLHTFYIIKNHILRSFIIAARPLLFNTTIQSYSDRWFMERDFPHIVDLQGYLPSACFMSGNFSTKYKTPTKNDLFEKFNKWKKENINKQYHPKEDNFIKLVSKLTYK